jgi:hypothetical protein
MKHKEAVFLFSLLIICNVIDGGTTLFVLDQHSATEINPVMAAAYEVGWLFFLAMKSTFVVGGTAVLWELRSHPKIRFAMYSLVGIYFFLCVYEILSIYLMRKP